MIASAPRRSRASYQFVVLICAVFLLNTWSASAHTLLTARKCPVPHDHFTVNCLPGVGCASDWPVAEKQSGFRSADRVYVGTSAWNCHGRTFDNRRSWLSFADPFLQCDGPMCPAKPQSGDSIIWVFASNEPNPGKTKHSVTIVGTWNGLDTPVMSKYGIYGQYRHTLRNAVAVYGTRWTVTRFGAGTIIYASAVPRSSVSDDAGAPESARPSSTAPSAAEQLLSAREHMPWYSAVEESDVVFEKARQENIRVVGALRPKTIEAMQSIDDPELRVQLLVADLRDREHYILLGAYNAPEPELLSRMEGAERLVEIALKSDAARHMVADYLVTLAQDFDAPDAARATALMTVGRLLNDPDRDRLVESVITPTSDETYLSYAVRSVGQSRLDREHQKK